MNLHLYQQRYFDYIEKKDEEPILQTELPPAGTSWGGWGSENQFRTLHARPGEKKPRVWATPSRPPTARTSTQLSGRASSQMSMRSQSRPQTSMSSEGFPQSRAHSSMGCRRPDSRATSAGPTLPVVHGDDLIGDLDRSLNKMLHQWRESEAKFRESTAEAQKMAISEASGNIGSTDPLTISLERLEAGLSELRIWDTVLSSVCSSESICPSRPLRCILERIRKHYSSYFCSLRFLFKEVRRRLKIDFLAERVQKSTVSVHEVLRSRLEGLERELAREQAESEQMDSRLRAVKGSLRAKTQQIFKGKSIGAGGGDPLLLSEKQQEEDRAEADAELAVSMIPEIPRFNEDNAKILAEMGAHVRFYPLKNGDQLTGSTMDYSHYYTFTLARDDTGVMLRLIQVDLGDDSNHLELYINHERPPTKKEYLFRGDTRNDSTAFADLSQARLPQGRWFVRVLGRGLPKKEFQLQFRVVSEMLDASGKYGALVDDLGTSLLWQQALTERLMQMESARPAAANEVRQATTNVETDIHSRPRTRDQGAQVDPVLMEEKSNVNYGKFSGMFSFPAPSRSALLALPVKETQSIIIQIFKTLADEVHQVALRDSKQGGGTVLVEAACSLFNVRKENTTKEARPRELSLRAFVVSVAQYSGHPWANTFGRLTGLLEPPFGSPRLESSFICARLQIMKQLGVLIGPASVAAPEATVSSRDVDKDVVLGDATGQACAREILGTALSSSSSGQHFLRSVMQLPEEGVPVDIFAESTLAFISALKCAPRPDEYFEEARGGRTFLDFASFARSLKSFRWLDPMEIFLLYLEGCKLAGLDGVTAEAFRILCSKHSLLVRSTLPQRVLNEAERQEYLLTHTENDFPLPGAAKIEKAMLFAAAAQAQSGPSQSPAHHSRGGGHGATGSHGVHGAGRGLPTRHDLKRNPRAPDLPRKSLALLEELWVNLESTVNDLIKRLSSQLEANGQSPVLTNIHNQLARFQLSFRCKSPVVAAPDGWLQFRTFLAALLDAVLSLPLQKPPQLSFFENSPLPLAQEISQMSASVPNTGAKEGDAHLPI